MKKAKGQVKLRTKPLKDGGRSLYLDIYRDGIRRYEFLHLYLVAERSAGDRLRNQETMRVAEAICSKRNMELQLQGNAMQMPSERTVAKVMEDYVSLSRTRTKGTQEVWRCWSSRVLEWDGCSYPVRDVNRDWWNRYTLWVQSLGLKPSTSHHYLSRMRSVLNYAEREGLLALNPSKGVRLPHIERTQRTWLTADELRRLKATPCAHPEVGRAFLFSCLCGLRLSDVKALTWDKVQGSRIVLKIQKTQRTMNVELNSQALEILGPRGSGPVFRLPARPRICIVLDRWGKAAGLSKHVTFHTSRHTFAVLALSSGVDIYTLSKILGHTSVTTTQIYADILDSRRREAVEMLPRI